MCDRLKALNNVALQHRLMSSRGKVFSFVQEWGHITSITGT
jgi:hypothetical protein